MTENDTILPWHCDNLQSSNIEAQPKLEFSWTRFFVKTGLSLTALGVVSQLVYNNYYSPSHTNYNPEVSPYKGSFVSCEDSAFKTMQTFFNVFETSGAMYNSLGFEVSEPFGDLQAFAFDNNTAALECAYDSYPTGQVTNKMINKLFGRVLRQVQVGHKELIPSLKWLLGRHANVNHQEKMAYRDLKVSKESTYTPLMAAYRILNADLYDYFISRGASPAMRIHSYSIASQRFDNTRTIIEAIIEDIKDRPLQFTSEKELDEAYLCPIYKKIIDSSLSHLKQSLSGPEATALRVQTYMEIQPHLCTDTFACSDEEVQNYEIDKLSKNWLGKFNSAKDLFDKVSKVFNTKKEEIEDEADTSDIILQTDAPESFYSKTFEFAYEAASNAANSEFAKKTVGSLMYVVKSVGEGIDNLLKGTGNLAYRAYNSELAASAGELPGKAVNGLSTAYNSELASDVGKLAGDTGTGLLNMCSSAIEGTANMLWSAYNSELAASAGELPGKAVNGLSTAYNSELAASAAELAGKAVNGLASGLKETGNLGLASINKATDVASGIANSDAAGRVVEMLQGATETVVDSAISTKDIVAEIVQGDTGTSLSNRN